jgi:hypothetical protein
MAINSSNQDKILRRSVSDRAIGCPLPILGRCTASHVPSATPAKQGCTVEVTSPRNILLHKFHNINHHHGQY